MNTATATAQTFPPPTPAPDSSAPSAAVDAPQSAPASNPATRVRHTPDADIQQQTRLLEVLQASPYLRAFNPRAYPLYELRHYRPKDYLNGIGVEKIGELVQHGFSFGEICKLLDISVRVMRVWVTSSPAMMRELDEARLFAADEERAQAKAILYDTKGFPDTSRAKAIAELHLWTAERWHKDLYGTKQIKLDANINNAVSYEFNINTNNKVATPEAAAAIEGVFNEIDRNLPAPSSEPMVFDPPVMELGPSDRPSLDFSKD